MYDFRCCGTIKDCNKKQYVMHYATVPRWNPVLSNFFIEKKTPNPNKKSIAKVKSQQRKCLKAGVGGCLRRNQDGGMKSRFTEADRNFASEFDITKVCFCNLGKQVAETQMR